MCYRTVTWHSPEVYKSAQLSGFHRSISKLATMEPILLTAHQDVVPEEGGDLDPWETPTSVVPGIDVVFQKLFGSIIPKADKIDVHHHWVPPEYADGLAFAFEIACENILTF